MPPGRPRKYFTEEERVQARRDKSKCSHEKVRRKEEINRKRREIYRDGAKRKMKAIADKERELLDKPADPDLRARLAQMGLEDHVQEAKNMFDDFQRLIKVPSRSFMVSVTETYIELHDMLPESARVMVENYYKKFRRYETILISHRDRVWNLVGLGNEYNEINRLVKGVLEVIIWIEDLQCADLDPEASVKKMFRKHEFAFQQ